MVGEGFLGRSEKLLASRPELLQSFFSAAVLVVESMMGIKESEDDKDVKQIILYRVSAMLLPAEYLYAHNEPKALYYIKNYYKKKTKIME